MFVHLRMQVGLWGVEEGLRVNGLLIEMSSDFDSDL